MVKEKKTIVKKFIKIILTKLDVVNIKYKLNTIKPKDLQNFARNKYKIVAISY